MTFHLNKNRYRDKQNKPEQKQSGRVRREQMDGNRANRKWKRR